jgi:dCMP deaminase
MDFKSKFIQLMSKCDERLSWDDYFACFALLTSLRSPSEKLKVGCVIIKNNRIISTGYNGFPSGSPHQSISRDGHEINTIHAEQNAINYAAKEGLKINKTTIYITHFPCINCCKSIIASGIIHIKYLNNYKNDEVIYELLKQTNISITKIDVIDNMDMMDISSQ